MSPLPDSELPEGRISLSLPRAQSWYRRCPPLICVLAGTRLPFTPPPGLVGAFPQQMPLNHLCFLLSSSHQWSKDCRTQGHSMPGSPALPLRHMPLKVAQVGCRLGTAGFTASLWLLPAGGTLGGRAGPSGGGRKPITPPALRHPCDWPWAVTPCRYQRCCGSKAEDCEDLLGAARALLQARMLRPEDRGGE